MIKSKGSIVFPTGAFCFILSLSIASSGVDNNQITKEERKLEGREDTKIVTFYRNKQKILERWHKKTICIQKIYYKDSPVARIVCSFNRTMKLDSVDISFFPPPDISVHILSKDKSVKEASKIPIEGISIDNKDIISCTFSYISFIIEHDSL